MYLDLTIKLVRFHSPSCLLPLTLDDSYVNMDGAVLGGEVGWLQYECTVYCNIQHSRSMKFDMFVSKIFVCKYNYLYFNKLEVLYFYFQNIFL